MIIFTFCKKRYCPPGRSMGKKGIKYLPKKKKVIQSCSYKTKKLNIYFRQVQCLKAFSKDRSDKSIIANRYSGKVGGQEVQLNVTINQPIQ